MGSDPARLRGRDLYDRFNSRSRMGSDPDASRRAWRGSGFQFTLPHGERPDKIDAYHSPKKVSIHAPAWGATEAANRRSRAGRVSIHAPAWGATRKRRAAERPALGFNSRSRMGSDTKQAQAVGVTERFNSRSRMGSDVGVWPCLSSISQFQFTLPHGERLQRHAPNIPIAGFNSRSRMGSDLVASVPERGKMSFNSRSRMGSDIERNLISQRTKVSIHAPAWGATRNETDEPTANAGFNSRSRMGSDSPLRSVSTNKSVSIHAPAWGATGSWIGSGMSSGVSIHAPAWGATERQADVFRICGVSIHAPAWGATCPPKKD